MANNKLVTVDVLQYNNEKIKEQLNKKVNIEQGVDNKDKILQVNAEGNLALVDMPDEVKVSAEEGNAITSKDDGLYVPSVSETKISAEEGNAIVSKDDGIYVAPTDLSDYSKTEDIEKLIEDELYASTTTPAHYEIADDTTPNALEVVADGTTLADGQIEQSSVTDLTVEVGDYVIWVEAATTKDAKFLVEADLDPYVAEEEVKVITEEELLEKLGLSEEELQGLAQLISDTEVRIDKTYSSSKIYNELNRILEEGKTYTLEEIAKSSGASYKIASSTAEMTSTKYIYLLANGDTYDMYICEEENSTPVKIGTTSVTLTDYYTKAECDERYVLATAFTLLNNSIGDVNNLQTTSKIIVDSVNEILASIGDITTLKTTAKDNITNAVNEVVDDLTETKDALGDITALETTAKDNVVNAVNEVKKSIDEFETYVELTQEEYDALADDETGKLNGTEYRTTDTGRIYKNGVQYGGQEPEVIEGFAKYKEMKEAGLIDPDTEYIVTSDENGILLNGSDVGYNNAESGIQATTVQGAVDKVNDKVDSELATKLDKEYITGITDANNAIGEHGVNIFVMSASSANMPISRTGVIRSYTTIENKYIRVNQEYSTIDNSPQNGGTYKRYGSSDDGGVTFTWSNWNFVGSIDDSTTASLKTWSSSKIASEIGAKVTKTLYRGSRSIDIYTGGKLTFIYSSEYASQAGCYMLLSNFNTVPLLIELGRNDIGQFKVTATHKSENVDTITVTTAGDEYSWYVLQF